MSTPPIRLRVEVDPAALRAAELALSHIPGGIRKAQVTAINNTLRTGRARASQDVRDKVTLKKRTVDAKLGIRRATHGQVIPSGQLNIRDTKFPLSEFNISPKRPVSQKGVPVKKRRPKVGVGIKPFKSGARTPLRRSWVFEKGGRIHVLRRPTDNPRAEPRIQYGPNISQALGETRDFPRLRQGLGEVLIKNLQSQVSRLRAGR